MKISDYRVNVILPATQDCFGIYVLSRKEIELGPEECRNLVRRGIIITSTDWKLIRGDIQQNCQTSQCTQLTGRFDNLFLAIDKGLQQLPIGN